MVRVMVIVGVGLKGSVVAAIRMWWSTRAWCAWMWGHRRVQAHRPVNLRRTWARGGVGVPGRQRVARGPLGWDIEAHLEVAVCTVGERCVAASRGATPSPMSRTLIGDT